MADRTHATVVDAYWTAVQNRDPSRIAEFVTDDFIEDWPQSGAWREGITEPIGPDA